MKAALVIGLLSFCSGAAAQQTSELKPVSLRNTNDSSALYGFTGTRPVKVGGSPANQRAYLESLRDGQRQPVAYERKGNCCAYPSENGFMGYALVDRYEITYRDEAGKKRKTIVYLSFYDYEEPMPLKGFSFANE